jgi:hypothetical protein
VSRAGTQAFDIKDLVFSHHMQETISAQSEQLKRFRFRHKRKVFLTKLEICRLIIQRLLFMEMGDLTYHGTLLLIPTERRKNDML